MTTKTHTSYRRGNNYHGVTKKIIGVSEKTLDKLDDTLSNLQERSKKYSKQMKNYIHHYPTRSMGVSFVAGFTFAILLRGWLK